MAPGAGFGAILNIFGEFWGLFFVLRGGCGSQKIVLRRGKTVVFAFLRYRSRLNKNFTKENLSIDYNKKIIKPTITELENHKSFLKQEIKKNNY